jgi:hypothetical protein
MLVGFVPGANGTNSVDSGNGLGIVRNEERSMGKNCDLPLHGITVVVDTSGPKVYIGRYHSENESGVLLNDVDVRELEDLGAKTAYLVRSAKLGVFKNTDRVRVPREDIVSVRRLIEYAAEAAH